MLLVDQYSRLVRKVADVEFSMWDEPNTSTRHVKVTARGRVKWHTKYSLASLALMKSTTMIQDEIYSEADKVVAKFAEQFDDFFWVE